MNYDNSNWDQETPYVYGIVTPITSSIVSGPCGTYNVDIKRMKAQKARDAYDKVIQLEQL